MKNPFPGMNPWLEDYWRDVHAKFLVYACDELNAELPAGLQARIDERLAIDTEEEKPPAYIPDVAITEQWDRAAGPVLSSGGATVALAEPIVVDFGEQIVRHLEIVDSRAHIITAIELLSPSNKLEGEACLHWQRKRRDYLAGGISLVEIDLLRSGVWVLPDPSLLEPVAHGRVCYHACVTRPPWTGRHEFYVFPLRERLLAIRVPLRRTDPDVALGLQDLINQCYERGRYSEVLDYTKPPQVLLPDDEAAWAREILAGQGG
ncbi:MAG: DUF4058 family protein [Verrucomicrobia bacterium]|nr:DUF4058 family protein [Verrucomicrobiota bacterium]